MLGAPELDAGLQVGSRESRVNGRITSLDLLATLFFMQPRIRLASNCIRIGLDWILGNIFLLK